MSTEYMKIGLIGAGQMAEWHIRGFRAAGADVVAVVDMNEEKAGRFAARWGIGGGVFPDVAGMVKAHPDLQAVSVITPNKFHHPLVLEALNAGLHVFCEKPPAINAAEMAEMASCAKARGKMLMFNLNNRARLDSLHVKKLIREGRIGRINSAQAVWQRRTGIPCFGGWFTTRAIAGGGPLIDLVHMIDLAMWFMDYPEPEYVLAQTFHDFMDDPAFQGAWGKLVSVNGTTDVESACHGFVRFKTGQVLTFHNSWAELVREEDTFVSLQAVKTGVMIRSVNNQNTCELYSQQNGVSADKHLRFQDDHDMGRSHMPENFVRALRGEAEPLSTPEEALTLMKLVDAAYCSAETGQPVKIV